MFTICEYWKRPTHKKQKSERLFLNLGIKHRSSYYADLHEINLVLSFNILQWSTLQFKAIILKFNNAHMDIKINNTAKQKFQTSDRSNKTFLLNKSVNVIVLN